MAENNGTINSTNRATECEAALKAEAHLEVGNRSGGESGLWRKAAAYKPEPR